MPTIISKRIDSNSSKNYILIGAGKNQSNFGAKESPYIVVCNENGEIEVITDFSNSCRALNIDGKKPSEILLQN